ncbi:hypothetical protein PPYR_10787 [Photinus pyralis]|uniref:Zinc transporter ZIP11 n=1 Tax=Photinus pyralis TaxID=7054 RepID=A0A1Y1KI30_PHOPY|nr:zinc transporter ZIP11 isoform X1 [Photinus pyralis]XP_031346307.1 zinc transporter ZIP11 isoform X1 [Photinus pyralis]XP_031346308.1 zinc transporter ZIP11 isoform X1 [Photinus pyralis]KAB0796726.1 hypothetical protein PPYR_10787 [Photinus pyralis]
MLPEYGPVMQALLGTLFTWVLTALGAALVIFIRGSHRKCLDISLGFAAGVMTAASFWSLLAPAIEMAEQSQTYGDKGQFAFVPVGCGFLLGALFVYGADVLITLLGVHSPNMMLALHSKATRKEKQENNSGKSPVYAIETTAIDGFHEHGNNLQFRGRVRGRTSDEIVHSHTFEDVSNIEEIQHGQWRRMMLLVIAITAHNVPEGLAVGVGFGAIGSTASATFESARNLAIGIGIQNFPEGLAVSLPLHAAGFSLWKSLWYGQLSGMVEPIFGVMGAVAVSVARPVLPYALSFAAGAMIYVVIDDIIPEANTSGNGKLATWGAICGFLIMMTLDVGLG